MNAELLQLFIYCLLKANHKDKNIIWNGKERLIKRGSFITGLHVLCEALNQKQTSTHRRLLLLQELGYAKIKTESKFTTITIVKYDSYQVILEDSGKQEESTRKTDGKETETNKNDNNDKINTLADFFEKIWKSYPNRKGKKMALRHFTASVKNDKDRADILLALENYKISREVKTGYIQYGSTWFNNWRDWMPEEKPEVEKIDYTNAFGKVKEEYK